MYSPALTQQENTDVQGLSLRNSNQLGAGVNGGAVAIEQERAIAEAQGQLVLAKRFPRNMNAAYAELMAACKSRAFAEVAFYSVPNRGSGPTIRFAEEVARVFGNMQYGHRELSRSEGKSEVEVYAWDMEKNNRVTRQITVKHVRDTKGGGVPLRDEADIDNKIANVASKQMRGRILAIMPKWFVEEAIQECRKTLTGNNDEPIDVRIRKMTQAFARFGVKVEHLERYLGHKMDETLPDELVDLTGVYNALKEGTKPTEFFGSLDAEAKAERNEKAAEEVAQAAKPATQTRRRSAVVTDLQQARDARNAPQEQASDPSDTSSAEDQGSIQGGDDAPGEGDSSANQTTPDIF